MKKKSLKIIEIITALVIVVLLIIIFKNVFSNKLVCKSDEGNITIMYNDDTITGYTSKNISYDLKTQREIVKNMGVKDYLDSFSIWFSENTTGDCQK